MKRLAVFGAGYVGFRAALYFKSLGYEVWTSSRSVESARKSSEAGFKPFDLDLTQANPCPDLPEMDEVLIALAPDQAEVENYQAIYLQGVKKISKALLEKKKAPLKVIYISSTGVWRDQEGDVFDESVLAEPTSEKSKILIEAENQILDSGLPAVVLRLSGIYGPGRNRLESFKEGRWPRDNRMMNMIYVKDIAPLLEVLFERGVAGDIYVGVDDKPSPAFEVSSWLEESMSVRNDWVDKISKETPRGKRYRNDKIKALGVNLEFRDFRLGYHDILNEFSKENKS